MDEKIVKLAKELIAIPSVTGDIENAVEVMKVAKAQLKGYDATPFVSNSYPSFLFSNQDKNVKKFKVILNAHLDVVPAQEKQFIPVEKDGRLYGRGAFDMKAAAAVNILLFKELGYKLSFPLGLELVADEETSGADGTGYHVEHGLRGEFVLIGECNSNFKVGNTSKGRMIAKISAKGKASHSAYAWLGKNAIWRMYEILDPIIKAYPIAKEETYKTTVNITKIDSKNKATNKIPDNCTAYLDIRYAPEDRETIASKIKSLLPSDAIVELNYTRPYHFVNPKNSYISLLRTTTKKVRGKDIPLRFAHATSDATFFSEVDCDAVEFGPVGGDAHHDNEYVDIQSLTDYYQILKNFLLQLDQGIMPAVEKDIAKTDASYPYADLAKK